MYKVTQNKSICSVASICKYKVFLHLHNICITLFSNTDKYGLDYKINFIFKKAKKWNTYNRYRQKLTMHFQIASEVKEEGKKIIKR